MLRIVPTILLLLTCLLAQANELSVGYFITPPHVIATNDKARPKGLVIDLWETLANEMKTRITWHKMPLSRMIIELRSGQLDAGSLLVPTPDRKKILLFPNSQWDTVQPGIAVARSHPLNAIRSPKDLTGLSIAYNSMGVVTPWFKQNDIVFDYTFGENSLHRLVKLLSVNRYDAIYWPVLNAIRYEARQQNIEDKIKLLASPMGPYPIKPVFPKTEQGQALSEKFDALLPLAFKKVDIEKRRKEYIDKVR